MDNTSEGPQPVDALAGARPGERWVLRHRLANGLATDVLGWIEARERDSVSVATSDGRVVQLRMADIIVARRAPAAAGGPDPLRTTAEALQRYALPGWLAISEPLGDWTLRAGGGFTARANSCLVLGDPAMPMPAAAAKIVSFSNAHGIAPMAQVIAGSQTETQFRALGWIHTSEQTDVLVCRLSDMLGQELPDPGVQVTETLTASWEAAHQRGYPNDVDPTVVRMILEGHPPRAFGGVAAGDEHFLAIARGHVNLPWLGLTSVWTDERHRGRGLAARIEVALGHWAARRGARYVYVQVSVADEQARRRYLGQRFTLHHRARYLRPPD